ncbi:hypothetical protein [Embleya sp. NPDC005971]|uniref:hypothetical protein n=1 Tax=Embleya sp. NPDC005971 TaxID=3156724 RepID=UPI0033DB82D9
MINDIEWGDAPTWIGAIGASLAAWAAFWTLNSQRRQIAAQQAFIEEQSDVLALQRAALIQDAEDRRTAQARMVRVQARMRGYTWRVCVVNNSDQPISEVNARFGEGYPTAEALVTGTANEREIRMGVPVAFLGPGRTAFLDSPSLSEATLEASPPTVTFVGVDGTTWETDQHNHVRPASAP